MSTSLEKLKSDLSVAEKNIDNPSVKNNPVLLSSLKEKIKKLKELIQKEIDLSVTTKQIITDANTEAEPIPLNVLDINKNDDVIINGKNITSKDKRIKTDKGVKKNKPLSIKKRINKSVNNSNSKIKNVKAKKQGDSGLLVGETVFFIKRGTDTKVKGVIMRLYNSYHNNRLIAVVKSSSGEKHEINETKLTKL